MEAFSVQPYKVIMDCICATGDTTASISTGMMRSVVTGAHEGRSSQLCNLEKTFKLEPILGFCGCALVIHNVHFMCSCLHYTGAY